jgi:DAHL domain
MDYDPFVRSSDERDAAVSQLRAQAAAEGLDEGPVDHLAAAIKIEETLTERFKSDNALLRNSLSYVTRLSASPGFHDRDLRLRALATAVSSLSIHRRAPNRPSKKVFLTLQRSRRSSRTREPLRLSLSPLAF